MKKVNWKKVKETAVNIGEWFVILALIAILAAGAALEFGFITLGS